VQHPPISIPCSSLPSRQHVLEGCSPCCCPAHAADQLTSAELQGGGPWSSRGDWTAPVPAAEAERQGDPPVLVRRGPGHPRGGCGAGCGLHLAQKVPLDVCCTGRFCGLSAPLSRTINSARMSGWGCPQGREGKKLVFLFLGCMLHVIGLFFLKV
jgi:hypothetical protein